MDIRKYMPLGLGCAPIGNARIAISDEQAYQTIEMAWNQGIRHFDTAPLYGYGLSETRLGHVLSKYPRNKYLISTKVGRVLIPYEGPKENDDFAEPLPQYAAHFNYTAQGIKDSIEGSLKRLQTDYIDICYIHDLGKLTHGENHAKMLEDFLTSGLDALCGLKEKNVISAIGLGVNEWEIGVELLQKNIPLDFIMLAGRYTLIEQNALGIFFDECARKNVSIITAGTLNSGILSGAENKRFYNYKIAPKNIVDHVEKIEDVCKTHNVSLLQAALHFPLLHPQIAAVMVGAYAPEEVQKNTELFLQDIPAALWIDLKQRNLIDKSAPILRFKS